MEESPVKKVLTGLRTYLHNNLRIDKDFIAGLSAAGLVGDSDADSLRSSVTQGGNEALYGLLRYIEWFYDEEMLEKFCLFLDDYSKKAKPRLGEVAARIRSELEKHQLDPIHQSCPQQHDSSSSSSTTTLGQDQNHLHQELTMKENTMRLKNTQPREQDALVKQLTDQLQQKDPELQKRDHHYAVLLQENQLLQQERDQLRRERDQLLRENSRLLSANPVVKKPPRNWNDIECQKILQFGGQCRGVAIKGNYIAVGVPNSIKVYDRSSTDLLHTIGEHQLGGFLPGVTFYDQEHILVSDHDNNNIKMFTIQGRHVRTIDRGSTRFSPYGITISPDGHTYVCDGANACVCVFDVNGKFLFTFGSRGSGDLCFDFPRDLCFASDGFLYITDVGNSRICVYDKDGKFIRKFTTTYEPWCIDATDCGHLIVSSHVSNKVMIYTTGVHVFGKRGSGLGQFDCPIGVSVDSDGLIYIADYGNDRIQVF